MEHVKYLKRKLFILYYVDYGPMWFFLNLITSG